MKLARIAAVLCLLGALAAAQDAGAARRLFDLANEERRREGAPELTWSEQLAEAALRHAQEMAARGELSHRFEGEPRLRQRVAETGLRFNEVAENVAYNSRIDDAHQGLMHSPGHRANILNPRFNAAGVAVVWRGRRAYVVQNFARVLPSYSERELEQRIVEAFNQARRSRGLTAVRLLDKPRLDSAACEMAAADRVSARAVSIPRARSIVAFTIFQPEELPSEVQRRVAEPELRAVAIGACFRRTPTYESGTNWVLMAFYQ